MAGTCYLLCILCDNPDQQSHRSTKGVKVNISLSLSVEEVNAILGVLGDLPTKTGAFPLVMKIKEQADAQVAQANPEPAPAE